MSLAYALFPTEIGLCGVVWNETGLTGVLLPEDSEEASRTRIAKRFHGAIESSPFGAAVMAVEQIQALMIDGDTDLTGIRLDTGRLSPLLDRIYNATRAIKPGSTRTYGQIAKQVGADPRSVGQAMGRNPWPIVVPCHRVMGSDGKLVGFSAHGGLNTKLRLLAIEKARINEAPGLFDEIGGLPIGKRY
jgi:methylated-DNA-[protein]-cysteine S-methyltransferase